MSIVAMQIERAKLDEFFKLYKNNMFSGQRLGQAFYNHFDLHKVQQNRPQLDRLYNMDNEAAKTHIRRLADIEDEWYAADGNCYGDNK